MSSLYWARYGLLFLMVLAIVVLVYAHLHTIRSR
jgi:hypothetical protein